MVPLFQFGPLLVYSSGAFFSVLFLSFKVSLHYSVSSRGESLPSIPYLASFLLSGFSPLKLVFLFFYLSSFQVSFPTLLFSRTFVPFCSSGVTLVLLSSLWLQLGANCFLLRLFYFLTSSFSLKLLSLRCSTSNLLFTSVLLPRTSRRKILL